MNPARGSGRIGKAVSDMDKKLGALTAAAAVAGAGAAGVLAKKGAGGPKAAGKAGPETCAPASYRNTELGKHEKNRKGI